jgi:uncharacterized protein YjiS (DUF1127 family)
MSAQYPVLPVAGGALLRAFASVVALVTAWLKELVRARRHRREANVLARLDRRMLADIGVTRADVRDAFSEPFWDDPTALLRERALERRLSASVRRVALDAGANPAFRRPPTDRPARQTFCDYANGRALSSAARSDTRDHPLSRPDPRPPAPPAGALFEFNLLPEKSWLTLLCLHNGGGLGYHARGAEFHNDSFQG